MAMDVRIVDGERVVCGLSAAKLKERFPEVELRLRGQVRPTSVEHVRPVLAINPRSRNVYVDVVSGAALIGEHVARTTAETAKGSTFFEVISDGSLPVDDFDDIRLDGSYGRAYAVAIVGDEIAMHEEPLALIVRAFLFGYSTGWRIAAFAWMRSNDMMRRVSGAVVVDDRDGFRAIVHTDRGIVRRVVVRGAMHATYSGDVDSLLRWIDSLGFDLSGVGRWTATAEGLETILHDVEDVSISRIG